MENNRIEELKKIRTNLSCTISTIRREIKNPSLSDVQWKNKVNRGLKTTIKYKEISDQLTCLGYKCECKAPHMEVGWWEYILQSGRGDAAQEVMCTETEQKRVHDAGVPITDIIKNIVKETTQETVRHEIKAGLKEWFNEAQNEQEYQFNIAWTDNSNDVECINNLLSIINEYLEMMEIRNFGKERHGNECIDIYRYLGNNFDTIKKTIQFMIDRWGGGTNISVYGKLCKF